MRAAVFLLFFDTKVTARTRIFLDFRNTVVALEVQ